jgi:hypothetical protein
LLPHPEEETLEKLIKVELERERERKKESD